MLFAALVGVLLAGGGLLLVLEPGGLAADFRRTFAPRETPSPGRRAAGVVASVLPYFGRRFVEAYAFLEPSPASLLAQALVGASLLGGAGFALGGPRDALFGALGLLYPILTLPSQADAKRRRMLAQLPDFAVYLGVFLEIGHSMHRAFGAATEYVPPPLRQELDRVLTRLVTERDPGPAIRAVAEHIQNPEATLFFDAVLAGFTTKAPVEVMRGLSETLDRLRDGAIVAKTSRIPTTMEMLIAFALLDTLLIWAVPFVGEVMGHMSMFTGGSLP